MGMVTNTEAKTYVSLVAKIVRIITIPPFMILVLLIVLYFSEKESFAGRYDMIIAVIGLVLIPLAAYPVHRIIPVLFNGGRKKQRKLAFIFSLVGYVICFAYALSHGTVRIKQIFFTYFITVVMLTIFNRLLGIRASGHAASSIAPCFFAFSFGYVFVGIIFAILLCISVWASLHMKRHKPVDIVMGVVSFLISYALALVNTRLLI